MSSDFKPWVERELYDVNFGDRRLNARFRSIADKYVKNPSARIWDLGSTASEVKGAYRLFDNDKVLPSKIREPHEKRTAERALKHKVVLNIQDSCVLSYYDRPKTTGLGFHSTSHGTKRDTGGLMMHNSYVLSAEGEPLGVINQQIWPRFEVHRGRSKNQRKASLFKTPFEEKESMKWVNGMEAARSLIDDSVEIINIADREADIYEFMHQAGKINSRFIVRAKNERFAILGNDQLTTISELFLDTPPEGKTNVQIVGNSKRKNRNVNLDIRYKNVTLTSPTKYFHSKSEFSEMDDIQITVVWAHEPVPRTGEKPISWLLLTNRIAPDIRDAVECINLYSKRWMVEIFHKCLKSGCKAEECRLEDGKRIIRFLTLASITAHRIMELTYAYRFKPKEPCSEILSEAEWKSLWILCNGNSDYPTDPPEIRQVINWLARQGGFLWRKNDGDPGTVVIWKGWMKLAASIEMYKAMKPLSAGNSRVYG
tara:strand:+ start:178 stop:1626 length:1449 start_codon:yes stop_codon:yes gene_type:complete